MKEETKQAIDNAKEYYPNHIVIEGDGSRWIDAESYDNKKEKYEHALTLAIAEIEEMEILAITDNTNIEMFQERIKELKLYWHGSTEELKKMTIQNERLNKQIKEKAEKIDRDNQVNNVLSTQIKIEGEIQNGMHDRIASLEEAMRKAIEQGYAEEPYDTVNKLDNIIAILQTELDKGNGK